MKHILHFFLLVGLLIWSATDLQAQKGSRSSGSSYKMPSYEFGGTKYKYGESYKSSGLPKVERSSSAKKEFLRSLGYEKVPQGYEVDHIIPLSKGGADKPYNMQLLPKEVHKQKTASERKQKY